MAIVKYVKPERVYLSNHPELNERWAQERIAEDPSLLGLVQMHAVRIGKQIALIFTTVLNEIQRGLVDADEEMQAATPSDDLYSPERDCTNVNLSLGC